MDQADAELLQTVAEASNEVHEKPKEPQPEPVVPCKAPEKKTTGKNKSRGNAKKDKTPSTPTPNADEAVATTDDADDIPKETPEEAHKRLAQQSLAHILCRFPEIRQHSWLEPEIETWLQQKSHGMGSQKGFTSVGFGKVLFPKWADQVDGPYQPSLATMLAFFGVHEVLSHPAHDKFRCIVAEHYVIPKIEALLSDPTLTLERSKDLNWSQLPFNIVNGRNNAPLPVQQQNASVQAQKPKREAPSDESLVASAPPFKRARKSVEDEARAFLETFKKGVTEAVNEALGAAEERLKEKILAAHNEITDAKNAVERKAEEICTNLDTGLESLRAYLKAEHNFQLQEAIKVDIQEVTEKGEKAIDEQLSNRFSKFEELLKEEFRAAQAQDPQAQGNMFWGMPSMQQIVALAACLNQMNQINQMSPMNPMNPMANQMVGSSGFNQSSSGSRKGSRSDQQQGNFPARRS